MVISLGHQAATREKASGRITCRVCDRTEAVPAGHPALLCAYCLESLDITRAMVDGWLESALRRSDENESAWRAALDASSAADRWPAVQRAFIALAERRVSQAEFDKSWQRGLDGGGAFAALLRAYEAYALVCDQIGAELARHQAAQDEINTAFLALEV